MVATVRLDKNLENTLENLSKTLHMKKSDVIREALTSYAESINKSKKSRILNAVEKTKDIDMKEFKDFEDTTNDGF